MADFDPKQVAVTFRGIPLTGFAPDTFISVERSEDSFSLTVGADGEYGRARSNNKSGTVTLTLLANVPANKLLLSWLHMDELHGLGKGPLVVKDLLSGESVFSAEAWITRPPNIEYGNEMGTREWVFTAGRLDFPQDP